ncbi:MAG: hypothetical protein AAGA35_03260 [Patescibacteria group bacterium]
MSTDRPLGGMDLLLAEPVAGGAVVDPQALYVPKTPAQKPKRTAPAQALIDAVLANRPLDGMPRQEIPVSEPNVVAERMLGRLFENLYQQEWCDLSLDDEALMAAAVERRENYERFNLQAQIKSEVQPMEDFVRVRKALRALAEANMLHPARMVPDVRLPDLFMAVPVWYQFDNGKCTASHSAIQPATKEFLTRLPSQNWVDTFLLFNHQLRRFDTYDGDSIPPWALERAASLDHVFDHIVLMTPYLDQVAGEWADPEWLRNIDPYLMGYIKGVPFGFVLARFSDSGIFPLYTEMVADTITFIRENIGNLLKKRPVEEALDPMWFSAKTEGQGRPWYYKSNVGFAKYIGDQVDDLLAAFDSGQLFAWLRGEEVALPTTA